MHPAKGGRGTHIDALKSRRAPSLVGIRLATLTVGAQTLHLERRGRGPPLLFLHDTGSTGERDFGGLLPAFAQRFDALVPDLRGHGRSPRVERVFWPGLVRDAAGILDALGLPRAHVVGVGDGATCALHLALECPERVASLVLGGARTHVADDDVRRLDALRPENLRAAAPEVASLYANLHGDGWAYLMDRLATSFRADRAYLDARAKLARVKSPTLVAHGLHDPLVPASHAEQLAKTIPAARLALFDHGRGLTRCPEFVSAVAKFLVEHTEPAKTL